MKRSTKYGSAAGKARKEARKKRGVLVASGSALTPAVGVHVHGCQDKRRFPDKLTAAAAIQLAEVQIRERFPECFP